MAMASILVGFVMALLSFALSLLAGYGVWVSVGFYVIGGLSGMAAVICLVALRSYVSTFTSNRDVSGATAQS